MESPARGAESCFPRFFFSDGSAKHFPSARSMLGWEYHVVSYSET